MADKIRFVYFGSSQFSRIVLEALCDRKVIPQLVISKPDKPKGRGMMTLPTEISSFAKSRNIPLIKPESLNSREFNETILNDKPDVFVIVDYGHIIPAALISIPDIFPLGVHPSLLPKYRGPAPIEYAIMNGDTNTGITIFKVNEKVDSGGIILQKNIVINDNDDYFSLRDRLAFQSSPLLVETISKIKSNKYELIPQNENDAVLTRKFKKEDGRINWVLPALKIRNIIRATLEWPSAYTHYKDLLIKILDADIIKTFNTGLPGTIMAVSKEGITVAAKSGMLRIKKVKPQGKNVMSAWSFVCGYHLSVGEKFS